MAVLLVAYDLHAEQTSEDYAGFMKVIKEYPWARLSESSYAISTTDTPETVYGRLRKYTDSNDDLIIINLRRPMYGRHRQDVINWLEEHLPY